MENLWHKVKISAGIISRRVLSGPLSVDIGLVDSCNYRCIMCKEHSSELEGWGADELARNYHQNKPSKSTVMDFDMYKTLIDGLYETGNRRIFFAGIGEPLLYKRIAEAISYAKARQINVRITTNGALLTNDLLINLISAGLDGMSVSLNSGSPDEYGRVHPNQENARFNQIVDQLVWLKEYKRQKGISIPEVSVSNVICSLNHHRVVEMMETGIKIGASSVTYRPMHTFDKTERFALSKEQMHGLEAPFEKARQIAAQSNIAIDMGPFYDLVALRESGIIPAPCFAGWLFPMVFANGDVTFCTVSREVIGNLRETSFKKLWFDPSRRRLNEMALKIHKTQQPVLNSRCFGCERALQNVQIYKYLWPLWGRAKIHK